MGEIKTIIDRTRDLTVNTATGKLSIDEITAAVKSYLAEEPTSKVLWNFLDADGSGFSGKEFQQLQEMVGKMPAASKKRKVAVVVKSKLGFGLSRLSETYAEISKVQAEHHIVETLEEAMAWLEQSSDE